MSVTEFIITTGFAASHGFSFIKQLFFFISMMLIYHTAILRPQAMDAIIDSGTSQDAGTHFSSSFDATYSLPPSWGGLSMGTSVLLSDKIIHSILGTVKS